MVRPWETGSLIWSDLQSPSAIIEQTIGVWRFSLFRPSDSGNQWISNQNPVGPGVRGGGTNNKAIIVLFRSSATFWSEHRSSVFLLIIIRVRWPWLIRTSWFSALINQATKIKWYKLIRSSESSGSVSSGPYQLDHQIPLVLIDQSLRIQWPLLIRPPEDRGLYW
jgi:hypothetical protein